MHGRELGRSRKQKMDEGVHQTAMNGNNGTAMRKTGKLRPWKSGGMLQNNHRTWLFGLYVRRTKEGEGG